MLLGKKGEEIAKRCLQAKGYLLLEENFRTRWGEIDLIMEDQEGVVFVEVKTRTAGNTIAPNDRLSERKVARLERAASIFLMKHQANSWRFLLVSVTKVGEKFYIRERLF